MCSSSSISNVPVNNVSTYTVQPLFQLVKSVVSSATVLVKGDLVFNQLSFDAAERIICHSLLIRVKTDSSQVISN